MTDSFPELKSQLVTARDLHIEGRPFHAGTPAAVVQAQTGCTDQHLQDLVNARHMVVPEDDVFGDAPVPIRANEAPPPEAAAPQVRIVLASEGAVAAAEEAGLSVAEFAEIEGTGQRGQVNKPDVARYLAEREADSGERED